MTPDDWPDPKNYWVWSDPETPFTVEAGRAYFVCNTCHTTVTLGDLSTLGPLALVLCPNRAAHDVSLN
jgi:hypothetical protein